MREKRGGFWCGDRDSKSPPLPSDGGDIMTLDQKGKKKKKKKTTARLWACTVKDTRKYSKEKVRQKKSCFISKRTIYLF